MRSISFWAEGGIYALARDDNHRWNVTVGGTAEMLGGEFWTALFETNLHLVVDPNNNMSFNPRAFIWEEGIMLGRRWGSHILYVGLQQRCKHDADNVEVLRVTGREEQRALIYSSALARWRHEKMQVGGIAFTPLAEAHYYVFLQDQRFPLAARSAGPSVESYVCALRFQAQMSRRLSADFTAGATLDLRCTALGPSPRERLDGVSSIIADWSAELWAEAHGAAASLRLFARYAEQPDDFITPWPRSARLLCIGLRLLPRAG